MDHILVLRIKIYSNHIEQLNDIFSRLCYSGLKVNSPKCSFGLKEIPCLGYVITWYGIKPDLNKVQGVMDFGLPNNTTEA